MDRRFFLMTAGAAAAGFATGAVSFRAAAELLPARVVFGHLADTMLGPEEAGFAGPAGGWLSAEASALADDLMEQFQEEGSVKLVVHSGQLFRKGGEATAGEWLGRSPLPVRETYGVFPRGGGGTVAVLPRNSPDGLRCYAEEGVHFLHLGMDEGFGRRPRLIGGNRQLAAAEEHLAGSRNLPAVMVLHPPLLPFDFPPELTPHEPDRQALLELLRRHPQILLVLCGKALMNRAAYIPDSNALCLVTASTALFPCGARRMELTVSGGHVRLQSRFLQTRRLDLLEKSFEGGEKARALSRLGQRHHRSFIAFLPERETRPAQTPLDPNLAPWWAAADRLTLAVVSDTHLGLDKFYRDKARRENELIGHFGEAGSREIFYDILEQIAVGRHRIEFDDEIFSARPAAEENYLAEPTDALLIDGDLVEHGRREEAELMKSALASLPAGLRSKTLLALGNHDFFSPEFAPRGPASPRKTICDFYNDFGLAEGRANYVVELAEWLSLIVLDTVIAGISTMGMSQDQADWLEDQLEHRRGRLVVVASHHTVYQLSLVPAAMYAYLRVRSHFTPRKSAGRLILQELFARFNNVKLLISGHYHGVVADQFPKSRPAGNVADDAYTTHVQVPCTVEYPNGYRLFLFRREGRRVQVQYHTAYTRRAELRRESSQAPIFQLLGGKARPTPAQGRVLRELAEKDHLLAELARLNPYDLLDLNVRGFKDGTANRGRGNRGKMNLRDRLEWTLGE